MPVFDQLDQALAPTETRRRRQPKTAPPAPDRMAALRDARVELESLRAASSELEQQLADAQERAEQTTPATTAGDSLEFEAHLRIAQDQAAHLKALEALQAAATTARASMAEKVAAQEARIKALELELLNEMLADEQAEFLAKAVPLYESFLRCRRIAWSIRSRLGRLHTPELLSKSLFMDGLPREVPYFTSDADQAPEVARIALLYRQSKNIFETVGGVDDELRG